MLSLQHYVVIADAHLFPNLRVSLPLSEFKTAEKGKETEGKTLLKFMRIIHRLESAIKKHNFCGIDNSNF